MEPNMKSSSQEREQKILEAAMMAFSRYGYEKTKMEDIARAVGMSRPALYKTYRNKEHIFRELAKAVHLEAIEAARAALKGTKPFRKRLDNALIVRDLHLLEIGHSGPHADEIAELYLSLAGDLATEFNAQFVTLLTRAIETAKREESFERPVAYKSAKDFAHLLRLALEGVKKEIKAADEYESLARQLVKAMTS